MRFEIGSSSHRDLSAKMISALNSSLFGPLFAHAENPLVWLSELQRKEVHLVCAGHIVLCEEGFSRINGDCSSLSLSVPSLSNHRRRARPFSRACAAHDSTIDVSRASFSHSGASAPVLNSLSFDHTESASRMDGFLSTRDTLPAEATVAAV